MSLLLALSAALLAQQAQVEVRALHGDRVELADGRSFELYGLAWPVGAPLAPSGADSQPSLGSWTIVPLDEWRVGEGDAHGEDKGAWLVQGERCLNLELARSGRAAVELRGFKDEHALELVAAAREAQRARAGLWSSAAVPPPALPAAGAFRLAAPPPIAGIALPLHEKQSFQPYSQQLREIRALGANWVNLIVATRQDRVDSNWVPLDSDRTPPDWRIVETIREARALGLDVLLMPIVLIRNAKADEWRGLIKASEPFPWWRSYQRWIEHMADLATQGGASALSIGSEFISIEQDPVPWRRVILAARARFGGWLTYSANWDHFDKIGYWGELDFASMTGYFTLAQSRTPELGEVKAGWGKALEELRRLAKVSGLPVVFSEVGVPSQAGALGSPWDYTQMRMVDLEAQRLGFEAFRDVFTPNGAPAAGFHGGFLYDWWGEGGAQNMDYTARGKPAEQLWRQVLKALSAAAPPR